MPKRTCENQDPQPLTGMWVVEERIPGLPPRFVGAVVDFDTHTAIRVMSQWEEEQIRRHRDRLHPVSDPAEGTPSSSAPAARRPSRPRTARASHLRREK